jgi:ferredoxin
MDALVRFQPSGTSLHVTLGTTLLEAAHRVGLPMASACGADGICGRCGVEVLRGAAALSPEAAGESGVKRRNRVAAELRLACRACVLGPVEITASYW